MNITCNVIEDLLPLYVDGLCSKESADLIEAHLKECRSCQGMLDVLRNQKIPFEAEEVQVNLEEKKVLKKGLKKIKQRSLVRFASVLLVLCLLGINGVMIFNQVTGQGRCYESIKEIHAVTSFFRAIKNGNYEKAAGYIDYKLGYEDLKEAFWDSEGKLNSDYARQYYEEFEGMTEERYSQLMHERMVASLQEFGDNGNKIVSIRYYGAYRIVGENGDKAAWSAMISVTTKGPNATSAVYDYRVEDGKIRFCGGLGFAEEDNNKSDTLRDALTVFMTDEIEEMYY